MSHRGEGICVFVGPSLSATAVSEVLPAATVLGPAAQGDVYRAARMRPTALAIVDGYFERVPAVWHKEILWALHEGIPVYGSSSMGALRAAELAAFGMVGVGWVFERFVSGELTDDDEVAVAHGNADDGYRVISEAMVNIRRTLDHAVTSGVLDAGDAAGLVRLAKARFYPDRSWPQLLSDAEESGMTRSAAGLRTWLPSGRIDQKRLDALDLLDLLRTAAPAQVEVPWSFEHTIWWDMLVRSAGVVDGSGSHGVVLDLVIDELRLDDGAFGQAYRGAMLRALAVAEAGRENLHPGQAAVRDEANALCHRLGLTDQPAFEAWLVENRLDLAQFTEITATETALALVMTRWGPEAMAQLPDHLRVTGQFGHLLAKAEHKQKVLAAVGQDNPAVSATGTDAATLYENWFRAHGSAAPADVDAWARAAGYRDEDAFRRVLARDAVYRMLERT